MSAVPGRPVLGTLERGVFAITPIEKQGELPAMKSDYR